MKKNETPEAYMQFNIGIWQQQFLKQIYLAWSNKKSYTPIETPNILVIL